MKEGSSVGGGRRKEETGTNFLLCHNHPSLLILPSVCCSCGRIDIKVKVKWSFMSFSIPHSFLHVPPPPWSEESSILLKHQLMNH